MTATLPPYIYGRETGQNERVWTEASVRAYGAACAAAAVLAEREACAALCDEVATIAERRHHITDRAAGADACADAIRARKDTHE